MMVWVFIMSFCIAFVRFIYSLNRGGYLLPCTPPCLVAAVPVTYMYNVLLHSIETSCMGVCVMFVWMVLLIKKAALFIFHLFMFSQYLFHLCLSLPLSSYLGIYSCPCYYYPNRAGSSGRPSFTVACDFRTGSVPSDHWIKRGTALLMSLDNWCS